MINQSPQTNPSQTATRYLHPDFAHPLPTTLDAKRSPLAMLAQACNNIGKDVTPTHVPSSTEKAPPFCSPVKSSSPIHTSNSKSSNITGEPRIRAVSPFCRPPTLDLSPAAGHSADIKPPHPTAAVAPVTPFDRRAVPAAGTVPTHGAFPPQPPCAPLGQSLDALAVAHLALLKSSSDPLYAYYAALQSAAAAAGLQNATTGLSVPCRDPHCPCISVPQTSPAQHSPSAAVPDCTQCSHERVMRDSLLSLASHHQPQRSPTSDSFVCNWMSNNAPCGLKFASSSELWNHVQTHTLGSDSRSKSTTPPRFPSLSSSSACNLHLPLGAAGYSPPLSAPRRSSSLSPANGRFHPYSRPMHSLLGLSSLAAAAAAPASVLSPYTNFYESHKLASLL